MRKWKDIATAFGRALVCMLNPAPRERDRKSCAPRPTKRGCVSNSNAIRRTACSATNKLRVRIAAS